jgi:hypothetical protein
MTTMTTLRQAAPLARLPLAGARFALSAALKPVAVFARFMVGSNRGGPRGYRREGFPEHELYQVISGKRDKFHDL